MTLEDAFLQAIIEGSEDDLPRLAYADWLLDGGDPRGDFIHAQCRLARMAEDEPTRPELEAVERELLGRHQDAWLGPLRPLLAGWTFRRGFLDTVAVRAAAWVEHASIPWPPTVRHVRVDLTGFDVPQEVIELVPEAVAYNNGLLPIGLRGRTLVLAMSEPMEPVLVQKLEFVLNRYIDLVAAPAQQIREAFARHYDGPGEADPSMFVSTT